MTSLYSQFLLVALFLLSMNLLRAYRQPGLYGAPYSWVLGGGTLLAIWGFDPSGQQWGIVAIGLCVFAVVLPAVLEALGQWLFERGQWNMAVYCSSLRSALSFGGKAQQQTELWSALAKLESGGVDASIAKLRALLQEAEEPALRRGLNEQILSLNFLAGRWQAGIEQYERHLKGHSSRAINSMGGALVRAYTELERWDEAEDVLERLEGQAEIRPSSMIAQSLTHAQLAYIAAAGKSESIETLVSDEHRLRFAVGADGAALMRAIAYRQGGDVARARQEVERIETSSQGGSPLSHWMAKTMADSLDKSAAKVPPAAKRRADITARQLSKQLENDAVVVVRPTPWVSMVVMAIVGILFALVQIGGGDLQALLQWGMLTPELWEQLPMPGAWIRCFTAPFLHLDVLGGVLDLYLLWLAGQLCERELGPLRYLAFVVAAPGLAILVAAGLDPARAGAGAPLALPIAAMTGCLWVMYRRRNRVMAGRYRGLTMAIALLIVANVLGALSNPMGAQSSVITLVLTVTFVSVFFLGSAASQKNAGPRVWRGGLAVAGGILCIWSVCFAYARSENAPKVLEEAPRYHCALDGVALPLPHRFQQPSEALSFSLPLTNLQGFIDGLAYLTQGAVQIGVLPGPELDLKAPNRGGAEALAIFSAWPQLRDEFSVTVPKSSLSPAMQSLLEKAQQDAQQEGAAAFRVFDLRREGRLIARVFERDLQTAEGTRSVVLVSQPAERVDAWAELYAPILRDVQAAGPQIPPCDPGAKAQPGGAAVAEEAKGDTSGDPEGLKPQSETADGAK